MIRKLQAFKQKWEFCKLLHTTVKLKQLLFIFEIYMSRAPKKVSCELKSKANTLKLSWPSFEN